MSLLSGITSLFGGGSNSDTRTNNTTDTYNSADNRIAQQSGTAIVAPGLSGNITVNAIDAGAIAAGIDTANGAILANSLLADSTTTRAVNGMGTIAQRAIDANTGVVQTSQNLAAGVAGASFDLAGAGLKAAGNAFAQGLTQSQLAMEILGASNKDSRDSFNSALGILAKSGETSQNTIAAAAQRATDAVVNTVQKSADTASGNRTLYIVGAIVVGVVALFAWGGKKGHA